MSLSFLLILAIPWSGWILYVSYYLAINYYCARKIGLPLVILPIDCGNPFWMAIDTRVIAFFRNLPWGFKNFTRFNWRGWEIQDRYQAHLELGDAFIFVTPGKNWLQLCNVEAMVDIFARKGTSYSHTNKSLIQERLHHFMERFYCLGFCSNDLSQNFYPW